MIKTVFSLVTLSMILFLFGCHNQKNANSDVYRNSELTIFHAGSLSLPLKQVVEAFELEHPGMIIRLEAAGSVACARKIIDLNRECDIMASADYKVIDDLLIPGYASWNLKFAGNELVLAYHSKSYFKDSINEDNWYKILLNEDVKYGRSSPNSDPCGYRTVIALKLAEKYYDLPDLASGIISKDQNYIRPKEVDLVALMETNSIDYAFNYRSVAEQHGFSYLSLPDQINLKDPKMNDLYDDVSVAIQGKRPGDTLNIFGESMVYGVTILKNTTNKEIAIAFVKFFLDPEKGMKIIEQNGQHSLVPQFCSSYEQLPDELRLYAKIDKTNDFFDNEPFRKLPVKEIFIGGEIKNPGNVDFSQLPVHSLIVKETLIDGDSNKFIGAYRYDGYSLYDILNTRILEKKNRDEFPPIIDLYVEIENDTGEKALFSWGEIYYPNIRHQIIVATGVLMIKPSKTKNEWPLPEVGKIVVGPDLLTERNISNPVKITVMSSDMSFEITTRNGAYSPGITISSDGVGLENISELADDQNIITYPTIFYGRGRGIHSVTPFKGVMLKHILANHFSLNKTDIREGIFVVAAQDGYRAVYTFSEIMNRNDQSEVLVVDMGEGAENGRFRLFPAADFFSDRAIFAVEGIYFE